MNGDTNPSADDEPKIIIDSDWKEQVAKEREQAAEPASEVEDVKPVPSQGDSNPDPPPASFEFLVFNLFNQAMHMLGQIPDPNTGEVSINKPFAKHYIDTLDILSEKTKGNLSEDEAAMLSEVLHALRMSYVNAQSS